MRGPVRIQRKRTAGWRKPAGAVYVGRGSKFGNPYNWQLGIEGDHDPRAAAVSLYCDWLESGRGPSAPTDADIAALRGKDLMCWCALNQKCHADILLELANPSPSRGQGA
jgi:hypothetical protein